MTTFKGALFSFLKRYCVVIILMVVGSFVFMALENVGVETDRSAIELEIKMNIEKRRQLQSELSKMLNTTVNSTVFNHIVGELQKLKDQQKPEKWDFTTGLHFAFTIVSTVGYGVVVPKRNASKVMCIIYGVIGVPIFLYALAAAGTFKKMTIEKLLFLVEIKLMKKEAIKGKHKKILIFTVCLFFAEMLISSAVVSACYGTWTFLDSIYYWFITASTIGFGDYVMSFEGNNQVSLGVQLGTLLVTLILQSGLATIFETIGEVLEKRAKKGQQCGWQICGCFKAKIPDSNVVENQSNTTQLEKVSA